MTAEFPPKQLLDFKKKLPAVCSVTICYQLLFETSVVDFLHAPCEITESSFILLRGGGGTFPRKNIKGFDFE